MNETERQSILTWNFLIDYITIVELLSGEKWRNPNDSGHKKTLL